MITVYANSTKVHLPVMPGMAVATQRYLVSLQAVSGGMIHQVIGSLSSTTATPQWQGEVDDTTSASLIAMHAASSTCHLTIDDKCYRCVWAVAPDIRTGEKRKFTLSFRVVEDVTPC
jgi:sporulation-control protein spo0M